MSERELSGIILAGGRGKRMGSDLPKVLHEIHGKAMIEHSVEHVREAGIEDVIVVVGYGREHVMARLGARARFAVQEEQLGTGHAVLQALPLLAGASGAVVICYGDMPLLRPATILALVAAQARPDVAGAILTVVLDSPPDFGRIIHDGQGCVRRIVEVKDCTPEELRLKEVNVGVYCFDVAALHWAVPRLTNHNAQHEYYLTDVVALLSEAGRRVEAVRTDNLEESLGINDRAHLEFAERLRDIEYAESLYELVDASVALARTRE